MVKFGFAEVDAELSIKELGLYAIMGSAVVWAPLLFKVVLVWIV